MGSFPDVPVYLQYPDQTPVDLRIHGLHILQADRLTQQLLVERHGEPSIDVVTMEDGKTNHSTNKMEVRQMLLRG